MVTFELCNYETIAEQVETYYSNQDILVDSFWEDHVRESTYYQIKETSTVVGFLSIFHKQLISMFHVDREYTYLAQEAFYQVRYLEEVKEAFAPTGDEQLVSLCMDSYKKLEIQAYFTRDMARKKSEGITMRLATQEDHELIQEFSEGFFDDIPKHIALGGIYIGYKDDELIGFGAYEAGTIRKDFVSVGMFVRPEYRRKGIGTNLLGAMKEIVRNQGKKAISGCWYYNHNSLKTQLACGNTCSTRLLRFHF